MLGRRGQLEWCALNSSKAAEASTITQLQIMRRFNERLIFLLLLISKGLSTSITLPPSSFPEPTATSMYRWVAQTASVP